MKMNPFEQEPKTTMKPVSYITPEAEVVQQTTSTQREVAAVFEDDKTSCAEYKTLQN